MLNARTSWEMKLSDDLSVVVAYLGLRDDKKHKAKRPHYLVVINKNGNCEDMVSIPLYSCTACMPCTKKEEHNPDDNEVYEVISLVLQNVLDSYHVPDFVVSTILEVAQEQKQHDTLTIVKEMIKIVDFASRYGEEIEEILKSHASEWRYLNGFDELYESIYC